jgi:hypothetical protein
VEEEEEEEEEAPAYISNTGVHKFSNTSGAASKS